MNFHELKAMYLGIPVSSKMTAEIGHFSEIIEQEDIVTVIERVRGILVELSETIQFMEKKMEAVELDPVNFTCNRCGRCCEHFAIGVAREDIYRILEGDYRILPFLSLSENHPTFQFFNKKMIKDLNPSLVAITHEDLSSCVFFNSITKSCTIYESRPADCRLYPVGNKLIGITNLLCDANCFDQGEPVVMEEIQSIFDTNRPSDAAFLALYQLNPQGGWRLSAFKLALLFDRMAYLVFDNSREY
jgi:Fe-S-cluster containining protein